MRKGRYVIGFDTEDDTRGNVYLLVFVSVNGHTYFETRNKALSYLEKVGQQNREKGFIVEAWATNLEYDLINLYGIERIRELDLIFGKSYLVGAEWRNMNVVFRDTIRHIPVGVKKLGEMIGLRKLDMPNVQKKKIDSSGD